jgi:hypothetical protein
MEFGLGMAKRALEPYLERLRAHPRHQVGDSEMKTIRLALTLAAVTAAAAACGSSTPTAPAALTADVAASGSGTVQSGFIGTGARAEDDTIPPPSP